MLLSGETPEYPEHTSCLLSTRYSPRGPRFWHRCNNTSSPSNIPSPLGTILSTHHKETLHLLHSSVQRLPVDTKTRNRDASLFRVHPRWLNLRRERSIWKVYGVCPPRCAV